VARTGRPRKFDPDAALDVALRLFWEHGFEATTLATLQREMGVSTASFYAAFGSKEELFRAVIERYGSTFGRVMDAVRDPALPPREALETTLRASVAMQSDPTHPPGCLYALSASTCLPQSQEAHDRVLDLRTDDRERITACVRRGIASGELGPDTDADSLAAVFHSFMLGISTLVRDGVPRPALEAAVTGVMTAWDAAAPDRPAVRPAA
jgi:TetR/AcrR family transcriptional repressor for divergent bdcA